jgi:AraC-like DNA-binding protein
MTSSEVRHFAEPSELAAAFRGPKVDITVVERGSFAANLTVIDLGPIQLRRMSASLPLIYHAANTGGWADFQFQTKPGPGLFRDGMEIASDRLVRRREGAHSCFHRSSGPMDWGSISLGLEDMASLSEAVLGFDLRPPKSEQVITPPATSMATLQRLHAAAGSLAAQGPELIRNPEMARGLRQILLQALVACLESNDVCERTPTQGRHDKIMQRFHMVLSENDGRPIYMLEMARAVGASVRSLTVCCQEYLGMGPKRYLLLRRMHLAKQALIEANASVSTVTDIATRHGFWQFGRFSVQYKSLFGESPSVTLRRTPILTSHRD